MDGRDRAKIRKNFALLMDDLIVSEKFLACLVSYERISTAQFEEFLATLESKRKGPFLLLIQKRGPKAFGDFIRALIETEQDHLAETLDVNITNRIRQDGDDDGTAKVPTQCQGLPSSGASHAPMQETGQTPSYKLGESSLDYGDAPGPGTAVSPERRVHQPFVFKAEGIQSSEGHDSQFIPISVPKLDQQDPWVQAKLEDPEVYSMRRKPRGRVVILNNEVFECGVQLGDREGANFDAINLDQLFVHLDYKVDIWKDYTTEDLFERVQLEVKNETHKNADAFIMFIMSHGVRGYVYGKDGEKMLISKIVEQFDSRNCPSLAGKPKIFFIQACQGVENVGAGGDNVDGGANTSDAKLPGELASRLSDLHLTDDETITMPHGPLEGSEMADIHIVYSTAPGHLSWRDTNLGTWFVREFILVCNECAHTEEIKEILRKVRARVKARLITKGRGQIPPSVDYLEKKFYFLPLK